MRPYSGWDRNISVEFHGTFTTYDGGSCCHPGAPANGSNRAGGTAAQAGGRPMKIIVAALIALTLVIGLVAPASAFDPDRFWDQQQRNLP